MKEIILRKSELFNILRRNKFEINEATYSETNHYIKSIINTTVTNQTVINRSIKNTMGSMKESWKLVKRSSKRIQFLEKIGKQYTTLFVEM